MTMRFQTFRLTTLRSASLAFAAVCLTAVPFAAKAQKAVLSDRIAGSIDNMQRATLTGSTSPRAMHATDLGAIPADTPLHGMTIAFSRSAAQQTALNNLLAAQQDSSSPLYHQWLTPAQFGAQFGVSDNDLAATESWLQSQGFTIDAVSPSRDRITFSGTESAVEAAFGAPLHYFKPVSGTLAASASPITHVAPAHDLTLPAALAPIVLAVANLSDYKPKSNAIQKPAANFTSSVSGNYFLTPLDVATFYNITPLYNAGFSGSGQSIAVVGQSEVLLSDITNFQTAAGVASNLPTTTLVPNSGSAQTYTGDWAESDLDLEYTSSIANKASIKFIYTGNSPYYGVFDSVIYAIENDVAPIITISYDECEPDLGSTLYNYYEGFFQQAAAQGQTVVNSAGDSGSTGCYNDGTAYTNQQQIAVGYPSSSAYVTGLGGTEIPSADLTGAYFKQTTSTTGDVISSLLQYPVGEQTWNDDAAVGGLSAGGGGISILTPRPSWQTGVAGIPSGSFRLVPDVSLDSSPNNAGYLYCSSDNGTSGTGIANSCAVGFRNASGGSLTVAGGTSFAAPIFAGMVAIINQAKGYNVGQGLINPTLYSLAANATTYASAFHDITAAGNQCLAAGSVHFSGTSTSVCSGAAITSYAAGAGYDEATGLGSVNLYNLVQAYPKSASSLLGSVTTVTANTTSPSANVADGITIQVTGTGTTPTGTVSISDTVNGATTTAGPIALTSGAATYSYITATAGVHKVVFTYSGDSSYATSKGTLLLNVGNTSFTVSAPAITIKSGSSSTETITVTSVNGYAGTVLFAGVAAPTNLSGACYTGPSSVNVTAATPGTATFTIYTSSSSCPSNAVPLRAAAAHASNRRPALPNSPWKQAPAPIAVAAIFCLGCFRRRSKLLRAGLTLAAVFTLSLAGLGLSGCSNGASGTTTTTTTTAAASYSLTVYANDSVDSAVQNTGTFVLTVD